MGDTAGVGQPTPRAVPSAATTGSRYTADTVPIAVIALRLRPACPSRRRPRRPLGDDRARRRRSSPPSSLAGLLARRASACGPTTSLFVAVGIVPGAVIGGRIGYVLLHLDYYGDAGRASSTRRSAGSSSASPSSAGSSPGADVASLLGSPSDAGCTSSSSPVLFVLGAGKLTMVLAGAGQGQPSRAAWATAYPRPRTVGLAGAGAARRVPSQALRGDRDARHPALVLGGRPDARRSGTTRDGRRPPRRSALWALARAAVSTTWRDPAVVWRAQRRHADRPRDRHRAVAVAFVVLVARSAAARAPPSVSDDASAVVAGPGGPVRVTSGRPAGPRGRTSAGRVARRSIVTVRQSRVAVRAALRERSSR